MFSKKVECWNCHKKVKTQWEYCPYCREQLRMDSKPEAGSSEGQKAETKRSEIVDKLDKLAGVLETGDALPSDLVKQHRTRDEVIAVRIQEIGEPLASHVSVPVWDGARAIVTKNGEILDVLQAGKFDISSAGIGTNWWTNWWKRSSERFSGRLSEAEVTVVNDGEFHVAIPPQHNQDTDNLSKDVREVVDEAKNVLLKKKAEEQKNDVNNNTVDRLLEQKEIAQEEADIQRPIDALTERYVGERLAQRQTRLLEEAQSSSARAYDSEHRRITDGTPAGALQLKTTEGHTVGLGIHLFFRVSGNQEFIRSVVKKRNIIEIKDIRALLQLPLQNCLQSVATELSIHELYGNMDIRERIRDWITLKMSTTFDSLGITLLRVEGFEWFLGTYEEIELERARLLEEKERIALAKKRREIEREDLKDLQQQQQEDMLWQSDIAMERKKKEFDEKQRQNELNMAEMQQKHQLDINKQGFEQERERLKQAHDLELEKQQTAFNLEKRTVDFRLNQDQEQEERHHQMETWKQAMQLQHDQRKMQMELDRMAKRADHEMTMDRERFRQTAHLEEVRVQAEMRPEQILALAASRNPTLIPALQEYARAQSNEEKLRLAESYQQQFREFQGASTEQMLSIMNSSVQSIAGVAQAKMASQQAKVITGANNGVLMVEKQNSIGRKYQGAHRDNDGNIVCNRCEHVLENEAVDICGHCGSVLCDQHEGVQRTM